MRSHHVIEVVLYAALRSVNVASHHNYSIKNHDRGIGVGVSTQYFKSGIDDHDGRVMDVKLEVTFCKQ